MVPLRTSGASNRNYLAIFEMSQLTSCCAKMRIKRLAFFGTFVLLVVCMGLYLLLDRTLSQDKRKVIGLHKKIFLYCRAILHWTKRPPCDVARAATSRSSALKNWKMLRNFDIAAIDRLVFRCRWKKRLTLSNSRNWRPAFWSSRIRQGLGSLRVSWWAFAPEWRRMRLKFYPRVYKVVTVFQPDKHALEPAQCSDPVLLPTVDVQVCGFKKFFKFFIFFMHFVRFSGWIE